MNPIPSSLAVPLITGLADASTINYGDNPEIMYAVSIDILESQEWMHVSDSVAAHSGPVYQLSVQNCIHDHNKTYLQTITAGLESVTLTISTEYSGRV
jgi:hypothetical protein